MGMLTQRSRRLGGGGEAGNRGGAPTGGSAGSGPCGLCRRAGRGYHGPVRRRRCRNRQPEALSFPSGRWGRLDADRNARQMRPSAACRSQDHRRGDAAFRERAWADAQARRQ
ncbi:hypothetical protein FQV27_15280 [Paracoccus aurantiacus]|uniref:Uncharacterized protein n=1 Tax=Paracoccus aurantiacus TaxID=2599412 RepID=A0A5C6S0E5_9RHOB|nr:hypothetical protein FQV27_15280 [Paracoccus aurantiacus]